VHVGILFCKVPICFALLFYYSVCLFPLWFIGVMYSFCMFTAGYVYIHPIRLCCIFIIAICFKYSLIITQFPLTHGLFRVCILGVYMYVQYIYKCVLEKCILLFFGQSLIFVFVSTRGWTQGLMFARKALDLNHSINGFCVGYFWERILWSFSCASPYSWDVRGTPCPQSLVEMGSYERFVRAGFELQSSQSLPPK
jgi:hypothetical protein